MSPAEVQSEVCHSGQVILNEYPTSTASAVIPVVNRPVPLAMVTGAGAQVPGLAVRVCLTLAVPEARGRISPR